MSKLSKINTQAGDEPRSGRVMFFCPGCDGPHTVQIGAGHGPRWGYNGNAGAPTFTPSVLVRWEEPASLHQPEVLQAEIQALQPGQRLNMVQKCCHSFVTDGRIQFLGDCTHELANQTVDLPAWPAEEWGD
jgi:hypothetical protein